MPGAGGDRTVGQAESIGGPLHRGNAVFVEDHRLGIPDALEIEAETQIVRDFFAGRLKFAFHAIQCRRIGVADIGPEKHFARDDVGRIGAYFHIADSGAPVGHGGLADAVRLPDHARGAD